MRTPHYDAARRAEEKQKKHYLLFVKDFTRALTNKSNIF